MLRSCKEKQPKMVAPKESPTLIEEYFEKNIVFGKWTLQIVTYKLDTKYVCIINNPDPGATICRVSDSDRQGAQRKALDEANKHLAETQVQKTAPAISAQTVLTKISLLSETPPRNYTVPEFLEITIAERMQYILSGALAFYGQSNEVIPSGNAMKMLSQACAA